MSKALSSVGALMAMKPSTVDSAPRSISGGVLGVACARASMAARCAPEEKPALIKRVVSSRCGSVEVLSAWRRSQRTAAAASARGAGMLVRV